MFKHKCGGVSTEAEKRAEKGRGRSIFTYQVEKRRKKKKRKKEGKRRGNKSNYSDTPCFTYHLHHLNVALLVLRKSGGASLTILYYSGLELSACVEVYACVCVGGLFTPFFYLQIAKRRRLCVLVALADSCQGKKDLSTITKSFSL